MRLVDALAVTLRDWDVRYVFGVSGANIEHLHDAVHRLGNGKLRSVLAKSESGAAFMADCRARVHRTLGVCCATSGGGMMNLAVGVAEAYAESVPLLALVGQVAGAVEGRGGFQDSSGIGRTVDAVALFQSMSKYTARVTRSTCFWQQLHLAAHTAVSGRAGPSVLLFPRDVYDVEVGPAPAWFASSIDELAPPVAPDGGDVRALFDAVRSARSPVIVVGTGVERSSDPDALRGFVDRTRIPVVTTTASVGAFPHDHPLFLGTIGVTGNPSAHAYLNETADLLLVVGSGLNVMTRYALAPALARASVVAVNVDARELRRVVDPALVVEGDAGAVFRALVRLWEERPFGHAPLGGYALTRYRAVLVDPPPESPPEVARAGRDRGDGAPPAPLLQSEAIELLQRYLPQSGHLLFDAGNCSAAALHHLTIPSGVTTTVALGMGGMGYAIAGAIGAQLGESGEKKTVVVCGDGAFLMLGLEIHTAVELGLRILFVVFNNNKHGMCVTRQRLYFEGRIACAEYSPLDVATAARGLGPNEKLWVGSAATRDELSACLGEYERVAHDVPGVLELRLACDELPPLAPFLGERAASYVVRALAGGTCAWGRDANCGAQTPNYIGGRMGQCTGGLVPSSAAEDSMLIRFKECLISSMVAGALACSAEPPDPPGPLAGEVSSAASVTAGRRHFENRQPAANGRACATCHPSATAFTLAPAQVERLFQADPRGPLFASIDADDFQSNFTTLRTRALIRVTLSLPSNVTDEDVPSRRTIDVWRAIPSVFNTALTAPFLLDGRGATLEDQAVGAIGGHFQPHVILPRPIMEQISAYERSLFSSPLVENAARATPPADVDPPLNALQQQGKATFDQFCVACHGGLARDTPRFANRFVSVRVSETNGSALALKRLAFTNADGTVAHVVSPDPGRALITGKASDVSAFDIPPLRGIRLTAPYFHDHSAATLNEVVKHYNVNFFAPAGRPQVPASGIPALVAYLEAL